MTEDPDRTAFEEIYPEFKVAPDFTRSNSRIWMYANPETEKAWQLFQSTLVWERDRISGMHEKFLAEIYPMLRRTIRD